MRTVRGSVRPSATGVRDVVFHRCVRPQAHGAGAGRPHPHFLGRADAAVVLVQAFLTGGGLVKSGSLIIDPCEQKPLSKSKIQVLESLLR